MQKACSSETHPVSVYLETTGGGGSLAFESFISWEQNSQFRIVKKKCCKTRSASSSRRHPKKTQKKSRQKIDDILTPNLPRTNIMVQQGGSTANSLIARIIQEKW